LEVDVYSGRSSIGLFLALLILMLMQCAIQQPPTTSNRSNREVLRIPLPDLPCDPRSFTAHGSTLLVLDSCGTLVSWDPFSFNSEDLRISHEPTGLSEVTSNGAIFAVLDADRTVIHVYDLEGQPLRRYEFGGNSYLCRMAFMGESIIASTYDDEYLLWA
jgi:hypothetical protein